MKKNKLIVSFVVVLVAISAFFGVQSAMALPILGDVNSDGKVTSVDARIILRHIARLENLDNSLLATADVNGDGKVTSADARTALRYAARLINVMGGEKLYDSSSIKTELVKETTTKIQGASGAETTEKVEKTETTKENTTHSVSDFSETTTKKDEILIPDTTTNPNQEESTTKNYFSSFPDDLQSLLNKDFSFSGTVTSIENGKTEKISFACFGDNLCISSEIDGKPCKILKLSDNDISNAEDELYLINDNNKTCCRLTKAILDLADIDIDDFTVESIVPDSLEPDLYIKTSLPFNGEMSVKCYAIFMGNDGMMNCYFNGESIIGLEYLNNNNKVTEQVVFDSFSGFADRNSFSLDSYKEIVWSRFLEEWEENSSDDNISLEATAIDMDELKKITQQRVNSCSIRSFSSSDSNALESALNEIFTPLGASILYSYYYPNSYEFTFKDGSDYTKAEFDPLSLLESRYAFVKVPADNVDWILKNVYNVIPDKNITVSDDFGVVVYYYDGYYYSYMVDAGGIGYDVEISDYSVDENNIYTVNFDFTHSIDRNVTKNACVVQCKLTYVDGVRQWTILSTKLNIDI